MRGLDHVVHAVRDLEAARLQFEGLGFTTTPKALHPWGTGNHLVQMDGNFIEVLSVEHPEKIGPPGPGEFSFGAFNREFLGRREGPSMLVFSSTDAAADLARWRAQGLCTYAPFQFSRTATLPDGEEVTVAFSLSFVTHPDMPHAAWFVCQQHSPEHFWKPEYQRHANGAVRMECVWMQARDPVRHADFLAQLFPEGRVLEEAGGITLVLPRGRVAVRTPQSLAQALPGARLPACGDGPLFAGVTLSRQPPGAATLLELYGLAIELV